MKQASLFEYTDFCKTQEHLYLALEARDFELSKAQVFTHKLMQWSDSTWLLDLSSCARYWAYRCERSGLSQADFFRALLGKVFAGDDPTAFAYRAVLSPHPWTGILTLEAMRERGLDGFLSDSDPFASSIFRGMSWDVWWRCTRELEPWLFTTEHGPRSQRSLFHAQCKRMDKAMMKLGLDSPAAVETLDLYQVKRRYGRLLRKILGWTWDHPRDPQDFPWIDFEVSEQPEQRRALDQPLADWEHIKPLICEDLNRICLHPQLAPSDKVICLEWEVVLHDMTHLKIPVSFRHPHSLHQDAPHQRTTLLQARFAFERAMKRWAEDLEDDALQSPPLVSWVWRITEVLPAVLDSMKLFNDHPSDAQMIQLENKLPIELHSFQLDWNFFVDEDHHRGAGVSPGSLENHDLPPRDIYPSLRALHRRRPLFLYEKPRQLGILPSHQKSFLERTMEQWWQNRKLSSRQRDYYKLDDASRGSLWVYQDKKGQWYVHGVFA